MNINEKEFNFTGDFLRCGASCPGVGNHSEYEIREEIICTNLVERLQIIMMQLQWKISI